MKRVYCLYRVSSRRQVEKDGIPMQRIACHSYAECHGWEIIGEFTEKGVSGYKLSMDERDSITQIKEDAILERFDILLVFMFDRIGRRDDETPFVVEWLVKHKIAVWSVCEGEHRFDNHVDKLTNYIRYWQAAAESAYISERTRTRIRQLTEEGFFTGGVCPYGYQLIRQGRENKKKQPLYDLLVLPEEAEVVRLMFDKTAHEGCGTTILANYLNENGMFPKSGKPWNPTSLISILKSKLYIGQLHKGDSVCYQEHLRIITDSLFYEVQEVILSRKNRNMVQRTVPTYGHSLLAGFLYCGVCGSRMSSTHTVRHFQRKDGTITTKRTQKYICQRRKDGIPCECQGQHTYIAAKINQLVIEQLSKHLDSVWNKPPHELAEEKCAEKQFEIEQQIQFLTNRRHDLEKEMLTLQNEVLVCIEGKSGFSAEQINMMYARDHTELIDVNTQLTALHAEQADLAHRVWETEMIIKKHQELWKKFRAAEFPRKKMILSHFIQKITVNRDYKTKISFCL